LPWSPTDCTQLDCPSQVVVQPEPQLPLQVVLESQCETQPELQSTLQVFMCWQSSVTLEGRAPPSLSPPSPGRGPPTLQVPPIRHWQVAPLQVQAPAQAADGLRAVQPLAHRQRVMSMRMPCLRAAANMDTSVEVG
jgi:hypothetical protein